MLKAIYLSRVAAALISPVMALNHANIVLMVITYRVVHASRVQLSATVCDAMVLIKPAPHVKQATTSNRPAAILASQDVTTAYLSNTA